MNILDWFKNRPTHFDPEGLSDEMIERAIDKAVTLTNPSLKIVPSYRERLAPAVEISVRYLREKVLMLPPAIRISVACWSYDPVLRAFFAAPADIPRALGRSSNLRTFFNKYPELDEACFALGMAYTEQRVLGMSLQGEIVQRDVAQTVIGFSNHQVRICGHGDDEVRHLLGTQAFEYLVAQALVEIGEGKSERRELEDKQALIRSRLRLLQQQGPGLGSMFGSAPASSGEQIKLEMQLLENERQIEALGSTQSALDGELEFLRGVLEHPERYVRIEKKQVRLNTMNVVVDDSSTDLASDVGFTLAQLTGAPSLQSAFVLAHFSRAELPEDKMNFDDAERYL